MTSHPISTLLVGAEGVAEIDGLSWVREATDDEREVLVKRVFKGNRGKYRAALVDSTGRPYFLLTVLADAPAEVQAKAQRCVRCLRLTE